MTVSDLQRRVAHDSYVTLHYRIELLNGPGAGSAFVDTFLDRPATLQMGVGQWAPGIEAQLLERAEGEHFSCEIGAEHAYGKRNPDLLQWVGRAHMLQNAPPDTEFQEGDMVEFVGPDGQRYSGVLKLFKDDAALLDFNHPLADVDLLVEVKILGVL